MSSTDRIEKNVHLKASRSLTVTESGFDKIPAARRAEAFRGNEGGWTAQMNNIEAHVAG